MSGKAWTITLLTTVSFFTIYVHHAKSECMPNDLRSHFHDILLEEHLFEMKVFRNSKEQHSTEVLSVINTLCSTLNKNKDKDMDKLEVIKTIKIMLEHLFNNTKEMNSQELQQECGKYNCTDGYRTTYMNVIAFGNMYSKYCNTSLSGLECPSEKRTTSSTSNSPVPTASEQTTSSKPEISQNTTAHEYWSTASSTTTVPQFSTASSKTTHSPISDTSESNTTIQERLADMSIKVLLAASLLLNVLLLFLLWHWNNRNKQAISETQVRLIYIRDSN